MGKLVVFVIIRLFVIVDHFLSLCVICFHRYIPHPMIVGQIIGLLGVYKAHQVHTISPYMIPVHICLYSIHMLQEHFEIYDKDANVHNVYSTTKFDDHEEEKMPNVKFSKKIE